MNDETMYTNAWLRFYNDQILWRHEGISQIHEEIYRLTNDKSRICKDLWHQLYALPWRPYLRDQYDAEARRYDEEIGRLYGQIHHFETDIQYFGREIGLIEAVGVVDEPPPEGHSFMSLDEFLRGEWMMTSSSFPDVTLGGQDGEDPIISEPKNSDSVKDTHDGVEELSSLEEQNEKIIVSDLPIIVNSAEEPLPSVEDRKTLGGQGGEDPIINEPKNPDSVKNTHDGVEEFSSLEEQNEKIIASDMPIMVNSAKEPLPSGEDRKTLGGQAALFNLFGVAIFAENKLLSKPFNALVFINLNPHWLCGAHQKMALIWWLFEQQHYYQNY